jgi:DNA replication protein DnaC
MLSTVSMDYAKKESHQPIPPQGVCREDCPICGGAGWIRYDVEVSHKDFGKLFPCPNLDAAFLYGKYSGLENEDYSLDWSRIVDYGNARVMVDKVTQVIQRGYGWVYIWGDYGQAKTLVLRIATALMIKSMKPAAYVRMAELIESLRAAFDKDNPFEQAQKRLDFYANVPLLCIDEFEKIRDTEFAKEQRFVLMDRRYESAVRMKSITLMTANKNPKELDGYLADRIFDGRFTVIQLNGKSARPFMEF